MRIIILNQFFYPDHSATSQLMTDLAESLVERGCEVTALAGRGRYTGGEKLSGGEVYNGVRIERAWATSYGKRSAVGRLSDYLSFYIGASWKLLRLPRHDIVMALTTPPLIGLVALLIGRIRGMRVVTLMQDIYPDIAVALGSLPQNNPATRLLEWISRLILRGSDRIVVLSECMRRRIVAKAGSGVSSRIDVIHNWADAAKIEPLICDENPFRVEHDLGDRFVVLFSGNFGRVNEFSTVLECARRLRDRADIVFIFIGEGSKLDEIKQFSRTHNLKNLRLLPYQPREYLRYSLAAGHALLVTLADGLAGLSVPSKTYGILAAGRPVLYIGDPQSEIYRLIAENGCGEVVASGDSDRLVDTILDWSSDREKVTQLGSAARSLFESRFDRPHAVEAYMESFDRCMNAAPLRLSSALAARAQD